LEDTAEDRDKPARRIVICIDTFLLEMLRELRQEYAEKSLELIEHHFEVFEVISQQYIEVFIHDPMEGLV